MVSTPRSKRFAVASIAALGIALTGLPQASAVQPPAPGPVAVKEPLKAPQESRRVTLITGDRVTVSGQGIAVEPGPGRRGIAFSTYKIKDHQYVVPSDVRGQLANDQLDQRLFDVTGLIKAKYDDKSTKSMPVIVTYTGKAQKRTATSSAKLTRQLPAVNGAALKVDKAAAGTFLSGLGITRSAGGVKKVWLDGKREILLDKSVPQIGAPTAWQAGFTGKGVTVAVIDSGIDAKHPDLVGKVVGAKNFLDTPIAEIADHGTHVASTIAGTGAASEGRYKGVAPDAKLYDGTVCDLSGNCSESAILAGMEWAATEMKAKVINLSLGGPDSPGIDPLEEAVNRLTATTGALFVIAAGNSGGAATIGSPGSADAALTVGAVDHEDKLAYFSSRGPRVGDGAVKPDVTAPGVEIMAAKAGGTAGDYYQAMSGTSMSSPHVAGAAALLVQQHPNWKATELKGTLIASAKPIADQTAFEQGAGRIDLARGIKQSVFAEQGNLSFGRTVYPHHDDEPVTKTVTYRNLGDQAVTLSLAATLNAPDGKPAPAGSLQLSATTVTVPAGGTASIQAISSTRHDGPDGTYSGRLTATAGDLSVTSAIGVDKEAESYNLTLEAVGLDGKPTDLQTYLFGLDDLSSYLAGGTKKTFRLVKGDYLAENLYFVRSATDPARGEYYQLVQPNLRLDKDTTVVFDARSAKPIKITVPTAGAAALAVGAGMDRAAAGGSRLQQAIFVQVPDGDSLYTAQLGPDLPPEAMIGSISSQWAQPGADGKFVNSPYVYGLMNKIPGKYPTGFQREVLAKDLAVVQRTVNVMSDRALDQFLFAQTGGATPVSALLRYNQPATVKLLVDAAPVEWASQVNEAVTGDPDRSVSQLTSPFRAYRAGRTYQERHGAAAFTASPELVARQQDSMGLYLFNLMDADGNKGYSLTDSASTKLLSGGKVLAESDRFGAVETAGLPAAKTTYTLQATQTRQSYSAFSTRTDLSWTFTSEATDKLTQLPMVGLRYQPEVDRKNIAERTAVTVLPIGLEVQPGATLPGIEKLELQVSGDDGKTWRRAVVTSRGKAAYQAVFGTPKGAKTVSLKAHLVDAAGNVTDLTTIGAYPLR